MREQVLSFIAEMGDRLATIDIGRKLKLGAVPLSRGSWFPHETQYRLAEAYVRTKWRLDPSSRLATTDMSRKLGAVPRFLVGGWVPI